jgi:hypothetical protein
MKGRVGVDMVVHVEPFHRSTREPDVACDSQEPTATQASVDEHETLDRSLKIAAGPFGLARVDHVVPFHLRTSVFVPELPTAKQVVVVGHERFSMLPPPETLLFDAVHEVPSHCPINSPCDDHPIAMHRVLVGHETSEIPASVAPGGFGKETIDQCAPSQCSTSATSEPAKIESPTAKQLVTLAHDTRVSWLLVAPAGFGLDCTDHVVPFQRPISVVPRWSTAFPTPKQAVVLGQSTLRNSLCELEMGDGTIDQLVPFDRSTSASGSKSPTTWKAPTAKHEPAAAHDTDMKLPPAALGGTPTSGLATFDHAVPSNLCIHGREPDVSLLYFPTATHSVALEHETLWSAAPSLFCGAGGAAVAITDQLVPSHCSEKGRGPLGE